MKCKDICIFLLVDRCSLKYIKSWFSYIKISPSDKKSKSIQSRFSFSYHKIDKRIPSVPLALIKVIFHAVAHCRRLSTSPTDILRVQLDNIKTCATSAKCWFSYSWKRENPFNIEIALSLRMNFFLWEFRYQINVLLLFFCAFRFARFLFSISTFHLIYSARCVLPKTFTWNSNVCKLNSNSWKVVARLNKSSRRADMKWIRTEGRKNRWHNFEFRLIECYAKKNWNKCFDQPHRSSRKSSMKFQKKSSNLIKSLIQSDRR